jgi:hypothetical protein
MHPPDAAQRPACSFCGADAGAVAMLIVGPGVSICDRCVDCCNDVIEKQSVAAEPLPDEPPLLAPSATCALCALPADAARTARPDPRHALRDVPRRDPRRARGDRMKRSRVLAACVVSCVAGAAAGGLVAEHATLTGAVSTALGPVAGR